MRLLLGLPQPQAQRLPQAPPPLAGAAGSLVRGKATGSPRCAIGAGVGVSVGAGVAVGAGVFVGLGVAVGPGVFVTVGGGEFVGMAVFVARGVSVTVGVALGTGVAVAVGVTLGVGGTVAVADGVLVGSRPTRCPTFWTALATTPAPRSRRTAGPGGGRRGADSRLCSASGVCWAWARERERAWLWEIWRWAFGGNLSVLFGALLL